jgi:hypothetical protein
MIGGDGDFHATHDLVFGVLHRHLFIRIGRIPKIFWLADQEGQLLRGVAQRMSSQSCRDRSSLFHIDQDEVAQRSSPPSTGFRDVGRAINIHAELSDDLGTQVAVAR